MPQIPTFEATPDAPTGRLPFADPGAFAAPGQALAQAGGQLGSLGADWEERYVEAKRQADASSLTAAGVQQLGDMRFRWGKVADQQKAIAGFTQEAQQLRGKLLAQAPDPLTASYVARNFDIEAAQQGTQTRVEAFNREASDYKGKLDQSSLYYQNAAAGAPDDLARAHYTDLATQAIEGAKAAGWITGEEAAQRQIQFRSGIDRARAESMLRSDPDQLSAIMSDPAQRVALFPNLLPQDAENLGLRADNRGYRMELRANAAQAHADAMAERDLRRTQAINEAGLYADIAQGKPVDVGHIADMARAGQLAPGAVGTLMAAEDRRDAGRDDPMTLVNAYQGVNDGTLTLQQVHDAVASRDLRPRTGAALITAIAERQKQAQSETERHDYNTLRTEFSAQAVESGLFPGEQKAAATDLWASAQREWTQRVIANHEASSAVLADIIQKYQPGAVALGEAPVAGMPTNPAQLNQVAVATVRMRDAGQLTDAQYQSEVVKLNRLRALLAVRGGTLPTPAPTAPALKPGQAPKAAPAAPGFGDRLQGALEGLAN